MPIFYQKNEWTRLWKIWKIVCSHIQVFGGDIQCHRKRENAVSDLKQIKKTVTVSSLNTTKKHSVGGKTRSGLEKRQNQ